MHTPATRRAEEEAFNALLADGRMAELCERARTLPRGALTQHMLRMTVIAALAVRDEAALRFALGHAANLPLAPPVRAAMVGRLAEAGRETEAIALLLADPGFHRADGPHGQVVVNAYVALSRSAQSPLLREAAGAALGRLMNRAPIGQDPSPLALPEPLPAIPDFEPTPVEFLPAGPAEERDVRIFRGLMANFAAEQRRAREERVILVRDVFITRTGEIWREDGRLLRDNRRLLRPEAREAMADAPVIEEAIDAVDGTGNFYHWIADTMAALAFTAAGDAPDLPVLIRDDAPGFVRPTLAVAAPGLLPRLRPVGAAAFVRRLHVGMRNGSGMRLRPRAERLYAAIAAAADAASPVPGEGAPLYVSRRDSPLRPMLNEAALEEVLGGIGVHAVQLSALPFLAQVRLFRQAPVIAAPHGAGLVHLLFARPGTQVLELMDVRDGIHQLVFCMARLSMLRGHRHRLWIQRGPPGSRQWHADIPAILGHLRPMLG